MLLGLLQAFEYSNAVHILYKGKFSVSILLIIMT